MEYNTEVNKEYLKNQCKAGQYTTNVVIVRTPLICFGGFGQPQCQHFKHCAEEVIKPILTPLKWRNFENKHIKPL